MFSARATKYTQLILISVFLCGCASPLSFTDNRPKDFGDPINFGLSVALIIDSEYGNARLNSKVRDVEFGDTIAVGTEKIFNSVFHKVSRLSSFTGVANGNWDLVAVPKIIDLNRTAGMWAFNDADQTIAVTWTLYDNSGKEFWVKTVKGKVTNKQGNPRFMSKELMEGLNMMLDDYYKNLRKSLIEAEEILVK